MKAGAEGVRRHNRALVLDVLASGGPRSRADVAGVTGLTKATVSAIVADLETERFVREVGEPVAGRPGRPATLIDIADHHLLVGLVIEVDHVGVCLTDLAGRVVAQERVEVDNSGCRPLTAVQRLIRTAGPVLAHHRARGHALGPATVAVPGLVDPPTGVIVAAPNLAWSEVDVVADLSGALGLEIAVANEADLVGTAEIALGWGRIHQNFVLVSAGVGVGAAVVIGGAVSRGAHGFGGELGHFVVDPAGPRCPCGNRGCLERYVGERDLPRVIRYDGAAWPQRPVDRAARGHEATLAALHDVAVHLGRALVGAVHLIDPAAVVLGGWLADLAPWLEPSISAHLQHHVLGARWAAPAVVASQLGRDAAVRGAALAGARVLIEGGDGAVGRA